MINLKPKSETKKNQVNRSKAEIRNIAGVVLAQGIRENASI